MKNILIFGFGVTGKAVANFCKSKNINFTIYDENLEATQIKEENINFKTYDALVLSPGIPLTKNIIKNAINANLPIISDIELFKIFAPKSVKIIAVTGSNGKSTTSSLIFHVLNNAGKKAFLGGNIGVSPLNEKAFESEFCVLEISSFQAEITNFKFDCSVLLNITPDHISHHGSFENYKKAKEKVVKNSNLAFANEDLSLEFCKSFSLTKPVKNGFALIKKRLYENENKICEVPEFVNLGGIHNRQNILAAFCVLYEFCKLSIQEILQGMESFKGLEHRIEFVKEVQKIKFFNDSKATNASSTLTALQSFKKENIFLIVGGKMKEEGIEILLNKKEFLNVKEIIIIGEAMATFAQHIIAFNKQNPERQKKYFLAGTLERATKMAFTSALKSASSGKNIVLLSPLCASFDQFKNFEERGKAFKEIVSNL